MYWFNLTFVALVSALLSAATWWDKYSKKINQMFISSLIQEMIVWFFVISEHLYKKCPRHTWLKYDKRFVYLWSRRSRLSLCSGSSTIKRTTQ